MKLGRLNFLVAGLALVAAAVGGFLLGYSLDPLFEDGTYQLSYARLLMRGGHTHGMLFAFFNICVGLMLTRLTLSDKLKKLLSYAAIVSLCLPIGLILRGLTHPSKAFMFMGMLGGLGFLVSSILILVGAMKSGDLSKRP